MGSVGAMQKGSKDRYGQGEVSDPRKLVPEGIEGRVPYKGNLSGLRISTVGRLAVGDGILWGPRRLKNYMTKHDLRK